MILLIFAILTYWAWILIHEFSHLFMAKKFLHVKEWTIIPYPHIDKGTFFFARMIWVHTKKNISQKKKSRYKLGSQNSKLIRRSSSKFSLVPTKTNSMVLDHLLHRGTHRPRLRLHRKI